MRRDISKAKYTAILESNTRDKSIRMISMTDNSTGVNVDVQTVTPSCMSFGDLADVKASLGWCYNKFVETVFGPTYHNITTVYAYLFD